jgi:hypothetical protein
MYEPFKFANLSIFHASMCPHKRFDCLYVENTIMLIIYMIDFMNAFASTKRLQNIEITCKAMEPY